jgi:hypothetical protein
MAKMVKHALVRRSNAAAHMHAHECAARRAPANRWWVGSGAAAALTKRGHRMHLEILIHSAGLAPSRGHACACCTRA